MKVGDLRKFLEQPWVWDNAEVEVYDGTDFLKITNIRHDESTSLGDNGVLTLDVTRE